MITISLVIPDRPPFSFISSACPNEWKAFEANCYRVFEGARPWNLAEIVSQEADSNLATVDSEAENSFLVNNFPRVGIRGCFGVAECTVCFTNLKYENWDTGEPRPLKGASCVLMNKES